MVVDTFRSTVYRDQLWPILTHEGPIPVSDTVLVHFHGSQVTADVKNPSDFVSVLLQRF